MAALTLSDSVADPGLAGDFRRTLAEKYRIIAPVYVFGGRLWLRISAQIYNEPDDYSRCAAACKELRDGPFGELFR
jgi:hypothetical protein